MAEIELSTLGSVIKTAYEGESDTNAFTDVEKSKLASIEAEATANASNADLRDRSTHTGTQAAATISDLDDVMASAMEWDNISNKPSLVNSVNGKTGAAVLDAEDVGALPDDYAPTWDQVTNKPAVYIPRGTISPPVPALYAVNTAGVTVPTATSTDYPLNSANFDSFSMLSNGTMIVPAWANHFRLTACINFESNPTGRRQASVFINGGNSTTSRVMAAPDAITGVVLITAVRPVNPGDVLDIKVYQTSGVDLEVLNTSWVQVELFEAT